MRTADFEDNKDWSFRRYQKIKDKPISNVLETYFKVNETSVYNVTIYKNGSKGEVPERFAILIYKDPNDVNIRRLSKLPNYPVINDETTSLCKKYDINIHMACEFGGEGYNYWFKATDESNLCKC